MAVQRTRGLLSQPAPAQSPNVLHPLGKCQQIKCLKIETYLSHRYQHHIHNNKKHEPNEPKFIAKKKIIKWKHFLQLFVAGVNYRGQLLPTSRQASSNTSDGGANRESSLDDSGVVDDHEDQDIELINLPVADVGDKNQFKTDTF